MILFFLKSIILIYTAHLGKLCTVFISEWGNSSLSHIPTVFSPQAASLPMSIIIVGVGPAEFDGKQEFVCVCVSM